MKRFRSTPGLLAVFAVVALTAAAGASRRAPAPAVVRAEPVAWERSLSFREGGHGTSEVAALRQADGLWGGAFTTPGGASFRLYATTSYPRDDGWLQRWANWIDSRLYHSDELAQLSVVFATPSEVEGICGEGTDGCYGNQTIVAPGENPPDGQLVQTVLTHEYGHHVAANRLNPPWSAIGWGPKRWASYEQVCRRVAAGQAFPGNEDEHYWQNPGEAWAQVYATAVQSLELWPDGWWPTVGGWRYDIAFAPDEYALHVAYLDATAPWTLADESRETWTGRLTTAHPTAVERVYPAYDGTFDVRLLIPGRGWLTVLDVATGKVLARSRANVSLTVCGQRELALRVSGAPGQSFRVSSILP